MNDYNYHKDEKDLHYGMMFGGKAQLGNGDPLNVQQMGSNKMDVKELRIGNYVIDNGEVCKVIQIESNGNVMTTCKSKFPISNVEDLEPVKLTENVLLMCGFESHYGGAIYSNRIDLSFDNNKYFLFDIGESQNISDIPIKDLHQLQNLYFALTGKELEVELPLKTLFYETES